MEKLLQDGVVGIVTGILTTVILFFARAVWDHKLRPFLEEIRYAGVKVDGKWSGSAKGTDAGGGEWSTELVLFLTQQALTMGGTLSLKHQSPDNSFELHFKVRGYLWEGYVILNFTPVDRRVTSYATTLLKIGGGGLNLNGQFVFRNVNEETVSAEPVFLVRSA